MSTLKRFAKPFWSYESGLRAKRLIVCFEAQKNVSELTPKTISLHIFITRGGEKGPLASIECKI